MPVINSFVAAFVLLFGFGDESHHIAQGSLKHLDSDNPLASASQLAGSIGLHHCTSSICFGDNCTRLCLGWPFLLGCSQKTLSQAYLLFNPRWCSRDTSTGHSGSASFKNTGLYLLSICLSNEGSGFRLVPSKLWRASMLSVRGNQWRAVRLR